MLDQETGSPVLEGRAGETLRVCPKCQPQFQPKRRNQKYCTSGCQKNASRSSRKAEYKVVNQKHYSRAIDLAEMVFSKPVEERLGAMKDILSLIPVDAGLRNILRDPKLLRANPSLSQGLFYRGQTKTISQAANAYTQKFFGVSIKTYIGQVLDGSLDENFPVAQSKYNGAVPSLKKLKKPKCWHRQLQPEKCGLPGM
ncbi:hypothetical protein [Aliiroseovarius crassostreae]|uniref:hypothetical protein n=1 Tax=Aliiroseovarius crassostreae TaxID=154981 RepID=UPI0021FB05D0|nr:hypothetical protein [Aliiroseovarius crassostreae]UWP99467.1 hypothetical protein K3X53_04800 [Aliiroseovarius crassostreae]